MNINTSAVIETFSVLQEQAGKTAKDKGFREEIEAIQASGDAGAVRRAQGNALMLMVRRLSEGLEENRDGRGANETYYSYKPVPPSLAVEFASGAEATAHWESTQTPKPEGLPSELADTVIRIVEFSDAWGIDLGRAIVEKMIYNDTRERMHGKKF